MNRFFTPTGNNLIDYNLRVVENNFQRMDVTNELPSPQPAMFGTDMIYSDPVVGDVPSICLQTASGAGYTWTPYMGDVYVGPTGPLIGSVKPFLPVADSYKDKDQAARIQNAFDTIETDFQKLNISATLPVADASLRGVKWQLQLPDSSEIMLICCQAADGTYYWKGPVAAPATSGPLPPDPIPNPTPNPDPDPTEGDLILDHFDSTAGMWKSEMEGLVFVAQDTDSKIEGSASMRIGTGVLIDDFDTNKFTFDKGEGEVDATDKAEGVASLKMSNDEVICGLAPRKTGTPSYSLGWTDDVFFASGGRLYNEMGPVIDGTKYKGRKISYFDIYGLFTDPPLSCLHWAEIRESATDRTFYNTPQAPWGALIATSNTVSTTQAKAASNTIYPDAKVLRFTFDPPISVPEREFIILPRQTPMDAAVGTTEGFLGVVPEDNTDFRSAYFIRRIDYSGLSLPQAAPGYYGEGYQDGLCAYYLKEKTGEIKADRDIGTRIDLTGLESIKFKMKSTYTSGKLNVKLTNKNGFTFDKDFPVSEQGFTEKTWDISEIEDRDKNDLTKIDLKLTFTSAPDSDKDLWLDIMQAFPPGSSDDASIVPRAFSGGFNLNRYNKLLIWVKGEPGSVAKFGFKTGYTWEETDLTTDGPFTMNTIDLAKFSNGILSNISEFRFTPFDGDMFSQGFNVDCLMAPAPNGWVRP